MTIFSTTCKTTASPALVLQSAITNLTSNGFAIEHHDLDSVSLTGPGLSSTKQNPILGASRIRIDVQEGHVDAEAELGGVDSMRRFLIRLPLFLGLGLGLFFGVGGGLLFGLQFGVGFGVPWAQGWQWMLVAFGGALLPVSPWLVLSPLMGKMITARTQRAIETLAHNAALATVPA